MKFHKSPAAGIDEWKAGLNNQLTSLGSRTRNQRSGNRTRNRGERQFFDYAYDYAYDYEEVS